MIPKHIPDPLAGEHIITTEPRLAPNVTDADWRRRPNLYTGRALSVDALTADQNEHAGRIALRGQMITPGIVGGLEVRLEPATDTTPFAFHINAGSGVAASGEDVVLRRMVRVPLPNVPIYQQTEYPFEFSLELLKDAAPVDLKQTAAILLLVPATATRAPQAVAGDPCEVDEEAYAFEDPALVDSAAVVFFAWPFKWDLPAFDRPEMWRSRLANLIFERERRRKLGRVAPWEEVGVPLALVGFDEDGAPMFVDRHAVARTGGAPRSRRPLIPTRGSPLLWQARMLQFSDHLHDIRPLEVMTDTANRYFRRYPAVGILPPDAVDYRAWTRRFFPERFLIEAVPIPLEQLDTVAMASASLDPLDATRPERVRVLVPVPGSVFEPRLLQTELLDPAFVNAIEEAFTRLGRWLKRREDVRGKVSLLRDVLTGIVKGRFPATDPGADLDEARYIPAQVPTDPPELAYDTLDGQIPLVQKLLDDQFPQRWEYAIEYAEMDAGNNTNLLLPPHLTSAPFAVAQGDTVHLLMRGHDWTPWYQSFDETTWSKPTRIDAAKTVASPLTGTLWSNGLLHAFGRGSDGRLWSATLNTQTPRPAWSQPRHVVIEGGMLGTPIPVKTGDSQTEIFVLNRAFSIYRVTLTPGGFGVPVIIDGVGAGGAPTVLATGNGKLEMFIHQADGLVRQGSFDGTKWDWQDHPGLHGRWLNACLSAPGQIDLVVASRDNHNLWHKRFANGAWSEWALAGRHFSLTPSIIPDGEGNIDVFVRGVDHRVWRSRYDGKAWAVWKPLDDKPTQMAPTAVKYDDGRIDVFTRGVGNYLWRRSIVDDPRSTLKRTGLAGLLDSVQAKAQKMEDAVGGAFSRVQAEIYRIRQLMLGTTAVARLGSSPVLAAVTQQAETRPAKKADVLSYMKRLPIKLQWAGDTGEVPDDFNSQLRAPPVISTVKAALSTKRAVLADLLQMATDLDFDVGDVTIATKAPPFWPIPLVDRKREQQALLALGSSYLVRLGHLSRVAPENLAAVLDRLLLKDSELPTNSDESTYFTLAIRQLEDVVAMLRALEDRIVAYRNQADRVALVLSELRTNEVAATQRLQTIGNEVSEARQDIVVARALMAEELARLKKINDTRERVLKQHVRFLVFQRPRENDLDLSTPTRALDTGYIQSALPAALANTHAAPPELWSLIHLLGEAPLKWLAIGPALLRKLDRILLLQRALELTQRRAVTRIPPILPILGRAPTKFGTGLEQAFLAQNEVLGRYRGITATLDFTPYWAWNWAELIQFSLDHISFSDLSDPSHGRSDVAREAAQELENISRVSTFLYTRFGEVPAKVRLEWAELLSAYDAPRSLRSLATLPGWNEIDNTHRRQLQELVDWLFRQMNPLVPEAVSLMNDVVRVAILLASHAPVGEIVSGHIPKPVVAKVGMLLDLAVEPAMVRVGMHVLVTAQTHSVQAVVEDLGNGVAKARVFSATAETVNLAEKTVAKFSEPDLPNSLVPKVDPAERFNKLDQLDREEQLDARGKLGTVGQIGKVLIR